LLSFVALAAAGSVVATALPTGGPTTVAATVKLVTDIAGWIFGIFLTVAVIFIIFAAFQFVTAGGSSEKVSEARQKLLWAAVGIGVALLSQAFVAVLKNFLTVATP